MSEERRDDKGRSDDYYENCKYDERMINLNFKKVFDDLQQNTDTSAKRSQTHADTLNQISIQALQNAVETANMVGKNATEGSNQVNKKSGINILTQIDEIEAVGLEAIAETMADKIARLLKDKK